MTISLQSNEVNSYAGIPDGEWFKGDDRVFSLSISRNAKLLFFALQTFRDNKTGYCWPSYATLADMVGVSRPTVIKAMGELTGLGVVKKESRSLSGGKPSSNGYWVSLSAVPVEGLNHLTPGVKPFNPNQTHITKPLQDSISCPYVRNAREAETTENLNPKPEREESPSSVLEAPLRGGREEVSEGGAPVPAAPAVGASSPCPAEPAKPRAVSDSGGAWGDDVPLPAPRHVYGQGGSPSEKPAKGSESGVQAAPVPSPTPDVPKRPRRPSLSWMRDAPKRWADDGKPTTIPPTFVPSPRHVAFGEAWGLDVELIGKRFVAKHLAEGTLVQLWDWHFAELLEMKRDDKAKAEREAEALKPELEAAEAARQAKRREWSDRLAAQTAGAVPPTPEFLALRPKMDAIRDKYGMKPKTKGERYGWRANSDVGWEPDGGPRTAVREQWDPGVLVHPGLDPQASEPGDPDVGGRGDDVRPLRRVEADGGERRRVVGEGAPGCGDRAPDGAQLRARGSAADVDQPGGGRDRPVPEVCAGERGEDDGPVDAAAEFFAWRRIRDAQLAG